MQTRDNMYPLSECIESSLCINATFFQEGPLGQQVGTLSWETVNSKWTGRAVSYINLVGCSDACHICSTLPRGNSLSAIHNEDSISADTSKPQEYMEFPPQSTPVNLVWWMVHSHRETGGKRRVRNLLWRLTFSILIYKVELGLDSFWVIWELNIKENIVHTSGCRNQENKRYTWHNSGSKVMEGRATVCHDRKG